MKKIISLLVLLSLVLSMSSPCYAAESTSEVHSISPNEISPTSIDYSSTFSIAVGSTWAKTLDVNKLLADPHNTIRIVVSNVTNGKFKIIVTCTDGNEFESTESTNGYLNFVISGAKPNYKYTAYIINTGTVGISGNITISSYYGY